MCLNEEISMERLFIGIDSGTTGIKAVAMDMRGNVAYKKDCKLTAICPRQDMYEEDMHEIWEKACLALKDVASRFPKKSIIGIGITAQGDGMWMIDKNGEPVRNGCCFCDGRAAEFVDEWVDNGVCDRLFDLTGTRIFTGNQNGIVKWMEKHEPQSLEKAAYILHLKDYLFYKLTGEITTDATDQSLIFLNQKTREYSDETFELCGLSAYRSKYPPVLKAKDNAFRIKAELADELGLNPDILVTSGPMDVGACALGSGVIEPGNCCSIIGTAALHEMVIDNPLADDVHAGMTVSHVMENRWLRLMASLAGTPNLEWAINTFGKDLKREAEARKISVYSLVEELVKTSPIGANGVLYHPYLLAGGERAPFTDSRARASYANINVTHTLADMLRATYEGVGFAMLDCYANMPGKVRQITVCGGGANSAFWCQMFADVLGTEIITVNGDELGAKGVVLNNAVVQGFYADYQQAVAETVSVSRRFAPDMENHARYLEIYPLYQKIRESLQPTWAMREQIENHSR